MGKNLIRQFQARGDTVLGLVRSQRGEQLVQSLDAESCWGDLLDADSLAKAADGAEVVIHAATAIPLKPKTSPKDWRMNDLIYTHRMPVSDESLSGYRTIPAIEQGLIKLSTPGEWKVSYSKPRLTHP